MRRFKNWIFIISVNLMAIFCFLAFATCVVALLPELPKAMIDMLLGIMLLKLLFRLNKIILTDIENEIEKEKQRRVEKNVVSKNDNNRC